MNIRRGTLTGVLTLAFMLAYGSVALAGPEWCDDGSPPPNDWRFRPTGAPSSGSSTSWLRSTDWDETSRTFSIGVVSSLEGGVARGMTTALERAGTKEPGERPERARASGSRERPPRAERDR